MTVCSQALVDSLKAAIFTGLSPSDDLADEVITESMGGRTGGPGGSSNSSTSSSAADPLLPLAAWAEARRLLVRRTRRTWTPIPSMGLIGASMPTTMFVVNMPNRAAPTAPSLWFF